MDGGGRIAADLECLGCGYNLRTLPADGLCTECAHPVRETLDVQVTPVGAYSLETIARCVGFCALVLIAAPIPLVGPAVAFIGVPAWLGFAIVDLGVFHSRLDRPLRRLAALTALLAGAAGAAQVAMGVLLNAARPLAPAGAPLVPTAVAAVLLPLAFVAMACLLAIRQTCVCAAQVPLFAVVRRGRWVVGMVATAAAVALIGGVLSALTPGAAAWLDAAIFSAAALVLLAAGLAAVIFFWWARGQFAARARSVREAD